MSLTLVATVGRSTGEAHLAPRRSRRRRRQEIAGRHREGDLAVRRAERDSGDEVVDDLGGDAREVDRVDAGQADAIAERMMIEHRLHDRLAVVEGAVDRQRMDVGVVGAGHHAPLHLGDAAVRKQHHEVDLGAAAERLDGGAAGVARGRDRDGGALTACRQRVIHQAGEQLHRQILEGERRPVEELEDEGVGCDLRKRRHGGMLEGRIGLARHAGEISVSDGAGRKGTQHLDGDLGIGPSREARDGRVVETRPRLRHIKAAVAREPREGHVDKAECRGFAPGRDVAHDAVLERRIEAPNATAIPPPWHHLTYWNRKY